MPIDTKCPGCGRLLRVGDEDAGRQARCPACSTIYVVPRSPAPVEPSAELTGNPFADRPGRVGPEVSAMSRQPAVSPTRHASPHRGGLILALGILGWLVGCPVFSVAAWMLGSSDLREMRYGRMDSSGMGITPLSSILCRRESPLHVMSTCDGSR